MVWFIGVALSALVRRSELGLGDAVFRVDARGGGDLDLPLGGCLNREYSLGSSKRSNYYPPFWFGVVWKSGNSLTSSCKLEVSEYDEARREWQLIVGEAGETVVKVQETRGPAGWTSQHWVLHGCSGSGIVSCQNGAASTFGVCFAQPGTASMATLTVANGGFVRTRLTRPSLLAPRFVDLLGSRLKRARRPDEVCTLRGNVQGVTPDAMIGISDVVWTIRSTSQARDEAEQARGPARAEDGALSFAQRLARMTALAAGDLVGAGVEVKPVDESRFVDVRGAIVREGATLGSTQVSVLEPGTAVRIDATAEVARSVRARLVSPVQGWVTYTNTEAELDPEVAWRGEVARREAAWRSAEILRIAEAMRLAREANSAEAVSEQAARKAQMAQDAQRRKEMVEAMEDEEEAEEAGPCECEGASKCLSPGCEGKMDAIFFATIEKGVCVDRWCYDYGKLKQLLGDHGGRIPHTREEMRWADLQKLIGE